MSNQQLQRVQPFDYDNCRINGELIREFNLGDEFYEVQIYDPHGNALLQHNESNPALGFHKEAIEIAANLLRSRYQHDHYATVTVHGEQYPDGSPVTAGLIWDSRSDQWPPKPYGRGYIYTDGSPVMDTDANRPLFSDHCLTTVTIQLRSTVIIDPDVLKAAIQAKYEVVKLEVGEKQTVFRKPEQKA